MNGRSPFDLPGATYRLQLSHDFTFDQAAAIVPYLAALGITHVYSSPFLKARSGSTHGYDVVDYNQLAPELGGEEGFARLHDALDAHGIGLILDFVPNHMGIGKADNAWWLDVLEWGQASPFSRHFDINWTPANRNLVGKLLVPILGQSYGETLVAGEIELRFTASEGTLDFWYHDHRLPLKPRDYPTILAPLVHVPAVDLALGRLADAILGDGAIAYTREVAAAAKKALAEAAQDAETMSAIEDALAPYRGHFGVPDSFATLHALLETQSYRLANWRSAADDINYRRFFDIGDLAGIRMDRIKVFHDAHALVGRLLAEGRIHGLRVDHVDGLADPRRYCRRLAAFAATIAPRAAGGRRSRPYLVIEKILAADERLRADWPVAGTTGYDYLALVNGLFIDPTGYARLKRDWQRFTGYGGLLDDDIYQCRRLIMDRSLASELTTLVNWLAEIAETDWATRDFTRKRLRDALTEIVAAFTVYRTYVTTAGADGEDRRRIAEAIAQARARWTEADGQILDFIGSLLTLDIAIGNPGHYSSCRDLILLFLARFQQYTGGIAAKAIEDTLFYRVTPLASANEVGADPRSPATSLDGFHRAMADRAAHWPHALLASATHDTKRGEDTRARLDVISEMPDEWARRIARWHMYNRPFLGEAGGAPAPTLNDEYLLYQTIVATWPMRMGSIMRSSAARQDYVERLKAYALKASREAKLSTSWTKPDEGYESAFCAFIDGIFAEAAKNPFLASVMRFLPPVLRLGAINGLTQLVLKTTLPGVPDFYQGTELWDLSLVDPDNRRPVDFAARTRMLGGLETTSLAAARDMWRDGWLKIFLAQRLLSLRARLPDLFRSGSYRPLAVEGPDQDHVVAFARQWEGKEVVVLACRFLADRLRGDPSSLWPAGALPGPMHIADIASRPWRELFSDAVIRSCSQGLAVADALATLPVAVLHAD
ncbi:MAG TPA: malto-oligosyltrehalose synthase [Stellaceae bacterium]|nr:malto-oligosyltrehalose synthase [Stellaceae bacterium]